MRPNTAALKALLDNWAPTSNIQTAPLYIFTLATGEVFQYSGFQTAVVAPPPGADTPLAPFPLGPKFKASRVKEQIGIEIAELDIEIYAGLGDLLTFNATLTWQQALWAGLFDGAYCELQRAFWDASVAGPELAQAVGTVTRFYGRVGDVEIGRTKTVMHVKSELDRLAIQMPPRLFQAACTHIFGAPMCGYDRYGGKNALGVATGIGAQTITSVTSTDNFLTSGESVIYTRFTPGTVGSYDNGTIKGLTGANAGFTRTIASLNVSDSYFDAIGQINPVFFLKPWVFPVDSGVDQFQLLPGCDHTLPTCGGTFNNKMRYGGFPDIPPPEAAV